MRNLVRDEPAEGFPTDYVISRIRGRRTDLVSDWKTLIARGAAVEASDEAIWGAFLRELEWLHGQLNRALRETCDPLFGLFEIKTIVLCLRNRPAAARLLSRSLLADDLKQILRSGTDVRATIAAIFPELAADFDAGRLQAFENALMRAYLEEMASRKLAPVMKSFFVVFIDLRNVVLLYKDLRWELKAASPWIRGGSIDVARLQQIAAARDTAALDDLVAKFSGAGATSVAATEGALETFLLRAMTKQLARMRQSMESESLIVEYVWRIYVQARNLAVLHHGAEIEPDVLERELVL